MDKTRLLFEVPPHPIWLGAACSGAGEEASQPDADELIVAPGQPQVLLVEDNHINQVVALEFLSLMGVQEAQVETVSFGKEKPKNPGHDETAWAENRRDDIVYPGE
jgi:hypothetical protein